MTAEPQAPGFNERLTRLEMALARTQRTNRLLKCALIVLVAGAAVGLAPRTEMAQPEQQELRVGTLIVDDGSGRGRLTLKIEKDGPTLTLSDDKLKPRMVLGAGKDRAFLTLLGGNDKTRVRLDGSTVESRLAFCDEEGEPRVSLGRETGGLARLAFTYKSEKQAEFSAFQGEPTKDNKLPSPIPSIRIFDEKGKMKWGE